MCYLWGFPGIWSQLIMRTVAIKMNPYTPTVLISPVWIFSYVQVAAMCGWIWIKCWSLHATYLWLDWQPCLPELGNLTWQLFQWDSSFKILEKCIVLELMSNDNQCVNFDSPLQNRYLKLSRNIIILTDRGNPTMSCLSGSHRRHLRGCLSPSPEGLLASVPTILSAQTRGSPCSKG